MPEQWDVFQRNINDKRASILVDLGFQDSPEHKGRPFLGWVFLRMNEPRDDGLFSSQEFDELAAIDELLGRELNSIDAAYFGRITTDGRQEFYFYLPEEDGFEQAAAKAMANFPRYRFETGTRADPEWQQYLEVLCPRPDEILPMSNRKILLQFKKAGDSLDQPREVEHFAYFASRENRELFANWAKTYGFSANFSEDSEQERPWGVVLVREDKLDDGQIDFVTSQLNRECMALDGDYDGWACGLAKKRSSEKAPSWWNKMMGRKS